MIPIDELIFFRGGRHTANQINTEPDGQAWDQVASTWRYAWLLADLALGHCIQSCLHLDYWIVFVIPACLHTMEIHVDYIRYIYII